MIKKVKQDRELWELFTKKEEYDPIILDKYGRLSYYLGSQRNVFEPEVSSFLIKNGLSPEYPEGKKFAVCLIHDITHDIDFVCPEMSKTAARTIKTLKKGQFVRASILPFSRINKTWSPLWNFRQIMELEENYGEKSTFYFRTLEYRGSAMIPLSDIIIVQASGTEWTILSVHIILIQGKKLIFLKSR